MTIDWSAVRTATDKAQAAAEADAQRAREAAQKYLAETDWMVVRETETGKPIPEDVRAARSEARKAAGG